MEQVLYTLARCAALAVNHLVALVILSSIGERSLLPATGEVNGMNVSATTHGAVVIGLECLTGHAATSATYLV